MKKSIFGDARAKITIANHEHRSASRRKKINSTHVKQVLYSCFNWSSEKNPFRHKQMFRA